MGNAKSVGKKSHPKDATKPVKEPTSSEHRKDHVVKQLTNLYGNGIEQEQLEEYAPHARLSVVRAMYTLLRESEVYAFCSPRVKEAFLKIDPKSYDGRSCPELISAIQTLWSDDRIKKTFQERSFVLPEFADYFIEKADVVLADSYVPTFEDMVRCEVPSTDPLRKIEFTPSGGHGKFSIGDIGGERRQRKRWIESFMEVQALLLFVVSQRIHAKTGRTR
jgi:hypothetical protein